MTRSDEAPLEPVPDAPEVPHEATPGAGEAAMDAALGAVGMSAPVADPLVVEEVDAEAARTGAADEGVRELYAKLQEADPDTQPAPTGGPWARWKQRTTHGSPFF